MKLQHQEEVQRKTAELNAIESRRMAMTQMEAQPTFAQLYLHIHKIGLGGITVDREGQDMGIS